MMIGEKSAPMWQLGLGGHPSGGEGVVILNVFC